MAARGLGKGLDALIPNSVGEKSTKAETVIKKETEVTPSGEGISIVKITKVEPNREQPRRTFDEEKLNELAESVKEHGIIQPITVQDRKDHYEIIAGERRWRAAKIAGLKEIPVIIKNYTEQEIVEISLIENIQRDDLTPIETAQAYKRLMEEFNLTQEDVAKKVSKNRATVANSVRLLKLSEDVQKMVDDGKLSEGHARALLAIEDKEEQKSLAEKIYKDKLSVRDVEKLMKNMGKTVKPKKNDDEALTAIYERIQEELKVKLGTKVTVLPKGDGAGKIEIEFYNHDDFDRLISLMGK